MEGFGYVRDRLQPRAAAPHTQHMPRAQSQGLIYDAWDYVEDIGESATVKSLKRKLAWTSENGVPLELGRAGRGLPPCAPSRSRLAWIALMYARDDLRRVVGRREGGAAFVGVRLDTGCHGPAANFGGAWLVGRYKLLRAGVCVGGVVGWGGAM